MSAPGGPGPLPPGDWRASYREAFDPVPRPPRAPSALARRLIFDYTGSQAVKRLLGLIFVVGGIGFTAIFAWGLPGDAAIAIAGTRTDGEVLSAELQRNVTVNDEHPTRITFRYRVGGAWHEGECSTRDHALIARATPGAVVPVEVFPGAPDWARVEGTTRSSFGWMGLMALLFPVVGAGVLVSAVRSNQREIRAFRRGKPAKGLVVKRGEDTTTSVNDKHPFEVVWEFQVDGATYKGSLSNMDRSLLDQAAPGNEVTVLYDPADPKVNTIWIG